MTPGCLLAAFLAPSDEEQQADQEHNHASALASAAHGWPPTPIITMGTARGCGSYGRSPPLRFDDDDTVQRGQVLLDGDDTPGKGLSGQAGDGSALVVADL